MCLFCSFYFRDFLLYWNATGEFSQAFEQIVLLPTKCKRITHGRQKDRSQLCLCTVWSDRARLLSLVVIYSMFRELFVFLVKRLHRIHYAQAFPDIWYFVMVCKCQVWIINTLTAKKPLSINSHNRALAVFYYRKLTVYVFIVLLFVFFYTFWVLRAPVPSSPMSVKDVRPG